MPQGEDELVKQAENGNQAAFEKLYHLYEKPLFRFVVYLAGQQYLAEELFQETWLRVAKNLGKTQVTHFKSWVFRIAANLYRDELRKIKIRRFFLGDGALEQVYQNNFEGFEIREELNTAIQSLSLKQRTIFLLFYVEGMKISEVSEIVGRAEGTIKATLHQTIKKLRKDLKDFKNG